MQKQPLQLAKLFLIFFILLTSHMLVVAQVPNSISIQLADTTNSLFVPPTAYQRVLQNTVYKYQYLDTIKPSTSFIISTKKRDNKEVVFYLLATLTLLLGCLKAIYSKYFNNLFKVFFNSSLRQSQLTDQLLQAKLPSLFYNFFFVVSSGSYVYLIANHFYKTAAFNTWVLLFVSILFFGVVYAIKYSSLKFMGWVTGYAQTINTYMFVLFLINKILGILLVPFSIAIAFLHPKFTNSLILISFFCIAFMFILRFFKSYGLVQNQLKISRGHFFLYIIGAEILPLLLIYKAAMLYLAENA